MSRKIVPEAVREVSSRSLGYSGMCVCAISHHVMDAIFACLPCTFRDVEESSPGCGATHRYWLPLPHRASHAYRIATLVWCVESGWAPSYFREPCRPAVSSCNAVHGDLAVPFACSAIMQSRAFSIRGPATWNRFTSTGRHLPNGVCTQFHQQYCRRLYFPTLPGSGASLSRPIWLLKGR